MVAAKQVLRPADALGDQVSKTPMSKNEINLHRLLKRCERQAAELDDTVLRQDLRFANYVAVLRDLLNEIQGKGIQNSLPSISSAKAQQYEERILGLEKRVDEQTRQATSTDYNAGSDTLSGRQSPSAGERGLDSHKRERPSTSVYPEESELRHRSRRSRVVATSRESVEAKPYQSGGKLSDDVSRALEQHRQLQEDLTDEMVELARAIKNNSLAMEESMKETGKVLDATERAVEHSVATSSHVNTRASKIYSATFRTGCFTWIALLAVSLVFFGMVFLIRIT